MDHLTRVLGALSLRMQKRAADAALGKEVGGGEHLKLNNDLAKPPGAIAGPGAGLLSNNSAFGGKKTTGWGVDTNENQLPKLQPKGAPGGTGAAGAATQQMGPPAPENYENLYPRTQPRGEQAAARDTTVNDSKAAVTPAAGETPAPAVTPATTPATVTTPTAGAAAVPPTTPA